MSQEYKLEITLDRERQLLSFKSFGLTLSEYGDDVIGYNSTGHEQPLEDHELDHFLGVRGCALICALQKGRNRYDYQGKLSYVRIDLWTDQLDIVLDYPILEERYIQLTIEIVLDVLCSNDYKLAIIGP